MNACLIGLGSARRGMNDSISAGAEKGAKCTVTEVDEARARNATMATKRSHTRMPGEGY